MWRLKTAYSRGDSGSNVVPDGQLDFLVESSYEIDHERNAMKGTFEKLLAGLEDDLVDLYGIFNDPALGDAEALISRIDALPSFKVITSSEGKLSLVEDKGDITDWGKNNDPFPFHLDGAYYDKVPRYVLLYCVRSSTKGGHTIFAEASQVIRRLQEKYDENLLSSVNIIYMSTDRKKYHRSLIEEPEPGVLQLNWYSSLYLEPDLAKISDHNRRLFTKFSGELITDIEQYLSEAVILDHSWEMGDGILFDNQQLLHSRKNEASGGNRLLYRIWIDKKNFQEAKTPIQLF